MAPPFLRSISSLLLLVLFSPVTVNPQYLPSPAAPGAGYLPQNGPPALAPFTGSPEYAPTAAAPATGSPESSPVYASDPIAPPPLAPVPSAPTIRGCAPSSCGGIKNIPYPFHLASSSPSSFCGYRNFSLICRNETLMKQIGTDSYYNVLGFNTTGKTISLVDADVLQSPCPRVNHNLTFDQISPLRYSPNDANLTFFFNCLPDNTYLANRISCIPELSYVFPSDEINSTLTELYRVYCKETVAVPVLKEAIALEEKNLSLGLAAGVMRKGFELEWEQLDLKECRDCERSLGRCGFTNETGEGNVFVCYCPDGRRRGNDCWNRGTSFSRT